MLDEINETEVEPTDELMRLFELGYTDVYDRCENVKGTDGVTRPYVYDLWSKDITNDYSHMPKCPWSNMWVGDDLAPIYDTSSPEGYVIRMGLANTFVDWNPKEVTKAVSKYARALAKETSRYKLCRFLKGNETQMQPYFSTKYFTRLHVVRIIERALQALLMLPPELIVSEEVAGNELFEVQRYLYMYLRETFN